MSPIASTGTSWRRRVIAAAQSTARTRSVRARHDESGAALIIALVFLIVGALALTALVSFAGGALLNTANLRSQRAIEYAADSATEIAIQQVRYRPSYYGPGTTGSCLGPTAATPQSVSVDTRTMSVYCVGKTTSNSAHVTRPGSILETTLSSAVSAELFTVPGTGLAATFVGWAIVDTTSGGAGVIPPTTTIVSEKNAINRATLSNPATGAAPSDEFTLYPPHERLVNFYTCESTSVPCTTTNFIVHAVVQFTDVSTAGHACAPTTSQSCGISMNITQWTEHFANH